MLSVPVQPATPRVDERVLRHAFRQSSLGVALLSGEGFVVEANPRLAQLFGTSLRRLRGSRLENLLPAEERAGFRSTVGRLIRGRSARHELESPCHDETGRGFWARLSLSPFGDAGQPPAYVLAIVDDVTERRAEDEALRRRTAGLIEVVRAQEEVASGGLSFDGVAAPVLRGVQRLTAAGAVALYVLDAGEELRFHSALGVDDGFTRGRLPLPESAWEALRGGRPLTGPAVPDGLRPGATGGLERSRAVVLVPIVRRGRPLAVVALHTGEPGGFAPEDVAPLQLLSGVIGSALGNALDSEEHQALLDRLAMATRSCPVAIFAFDPQGIVTFMDGAAISRLRPADLIGRSVFELFEGFPDLAESARAALAGHSRRSLAHLRQHDRHFEVRHRPVFDAEGMVVSVSGVAVDVTDRMEAELARRESDAKSRFLATMSHELRTPLNSVIGFAQLLGSEEFGRLGPRQRRYVENIQSSGHHLLALINDLLDIGRIQAGELDLAVEPVELRSLLDDAVAGIRPQAGARDLRITVSGAEAVWALADARRLHQVVINLLSNALKFTPAGGTISVACGRSAHRACLSVADTGIGIPEDQLERIFDEFMQVEVGRARGGQDGSGLGLALSQRLVHLMEGTLTVRSMVGAGSTFTVSLPPSGPRR